MNARDSILLIGATGRTGTFVLRYLCAASAPVIACVRREDRLPQEPRLAAAEIAVCDLEQPGTTFPLFDRAANVVWLAGSQRRSLSPGAWQLEVEALGTCLEHARASGFAGRFIYVGYAPPDPTGGASWAESRWRELKVEAEQTIEASGLNYFILRTGRITGMVVDEPRVAVTQKPPGGAEEAELPCNVVAFLLTGAALAGAMQRSKATVRLDRNGARLQEAVQAFGRLRADAPAPSSSGADAGRVSFGRA